MQSDHASDIPSAIDLQNVRDARAWAASAMAKRPWRTEVFQRITDELLQGGKQPLSILELGSGPGFLAHHVLTTLPEARYVALDFSPAMHELARERLGDLAAHIQFVEADFRDLGWSEGLGPFDAVLTLQAVHELRHKRHAPALYRTVQSLLKPDGLFLVCDHFVGPGGMSDVPLYMTPEEHEAALRVAAFVAVAPVFQKGGLLLCRARNPLGAARITPYDTSHQEALLSFFAEVWRGSRHPFDPAGAHADLLRISAEYQSGGGGFWLLLVTGRIVGTVAVRRLANKVAEVKRLNVLAASRGQGFGTNLLRHAIQHAKEAGFRAVRLGTIRNSGPALHLFEKHGFVEIPRYNDNPDANLFMGLDLRSPWGSLHGI